MARLGDLIDIYAKGLAEETGLDYERVRKVSSQAVRDRSLRPIPPEMQADADAAGAFIWPDLREGIPYLGPERVLQAFEEIGAEQLATRLLIVEQWARSAAPLYRLPELVAHLGGLRAHALRSRPQLIETGYPGELFMQSPWLGERLSCLYPVKEPFCAELVTEDSGRVAIHHVWTKEPWGVMLDASGHPKVCCPGKDPSSPGPVESCTYAEAPAFEGLDPHTILRTVALRPRVLEFKMEALRILGAASQDPSSTDSLMECLDLLTRSFSPQEVVCVSDVDWIFSQLDMRQLIARINCLYRGAGGVADTLRLALLVDEYRWSSAVSDLRDVLELHDLMAKDPLAGPRPLFKSYFEIIDKPYRRVVDGTIAAFWKSCQQSTPKSSHALARVHQAMPVVIVSRHTTWGRNARDFRAMLKAYTQLQESQLAATGRYGTLDFFGSSADEGDGDARGQENVFRRRETGVWEIRFKGKEILLPDMKGLSYLHELLRRPNESVRAASLAAAANPTTLSQPSGTLDGVTGEQLKEDGLHIGDAPMSEPIVDAKTVADVAKEIRRLSEAIDQAVECHHDDRAQALDLKKQELERYLASASGRGGRKRMVGGNAQRIAGAVAAAVNYARKKIGEYHPELGEHLRARIRLGYLCSYEPRDAIRWIL